MPQGTIKVIKPIGSPLDDKGQSCEGAVEILDGDYAGRIGYFKHKLSCCEKHREEEQVRIIIKNDHTEPIKVEIEGCD